MKGTKLALTSEMRSQRGRLSAAVSPTGRSGQQRGYSGKGLLGEEERTKQRAQCSRIRLRRSFILGIVPLQRISQSEEKSGEVVMATQEGSGVCLSLGSFVGAQPCQSLRYRE